MPIFFFFRFFPILTKSEYPMNVIPSLWNGYTSNFHDRLSLGHTDAHTHALVYYSKCESNCCLLCSLGLQVMLLLVESSKSLLLVIKRWRCLTRPQRFWLWRSFLCSYSLMKIHPPHHVIENNHMRSMNSPNLYNSTLSDMCNSVYLMKMSSKFHSN